MTGAYALKNSETVLDPGTTEINKSARLIAAVDRWGAAAVVEARLSLGLQDDTQLRRLDALSAVITSTSTSLTALVESASSTNLRYPTELITSAQRIALFAGELLGVDARTILLAASQPSQPRGLREAARFSLLWNGGDWRRELANRPAASGSFTITAPNAPSSTYEISAAGGGGYFAVVGASGAGKSSLMHQLKRTNLAHEGRFFDIDHVVSNGRSIGRQIDELGAEVVAEQMRRILVASLGSTDFQFVDVGALALLDKETRVLLRATASRIAALDTSESELLDRVRLQGKFDDQLDFSHTSYRGFLGEIFWLRRAVARSVCDAVIDTSMPPRKSVRRLERLAKLAIDERTTDREVYPEYSDPHYYGTPSGGLAKAVQLGWVAPQTELFDVGAGTGRNTVYLALVCDPLRIDGAEPSLSGRKATRRLARLLGAGPCVGEFESSIEHFRLKSSTYGAVIAMTTLSHLDSNARKQWSRLRNATREGGILVASVFLDDDPGATGSPQASPTAAYVRRYFRPGELLSWCVPQDEVLSYREYKFTDYGHGPPHDHSVAEIVIRRQRP